LLAAQLNLGREIYALVDDATSARALAAGLARAGAERPLPVMVELGVPGGRTGARGVDDAASLGRVVRDELPELQLAGVECFEATASLLNPEDPVRPVDEILERLLDVATRLTADPTHDPSAGDFLVSAGGSAFFDRVVEILGTRMPPGCRLVLRPGTYVTHDAGLYDRMSPVGHGPSARLSIGRLESALTLWSAVLSRPEPDLAILNAGRRDSPADSDVPSAKFWARRESPPPAATARPVPFPGPASIFAANDQHMYLRVEPGCPIKPGDLIGLAVSHPCLVMDRWRVVLVVTPDGTVTGAVRTFF
jgi:D-serine dehydratase